MSHSQSIHSHKEIKRRCTCWKGRQATSKKPFKKMFGWRHPLVKVPLWTLLPEKYRRQRIDWVHERRLINSSFDCLSKFSHADKRGWRRAKAMDFSFFFFSFFPLFSPSLARLNHANPHAKMRERKIIGSARAARARPWAVFAWQQSLAKPLMSLMATNGVKCDPFSGEFWRTGRESEWYIMPAPSAEQWRHPASPLLPLSPPPHQSPVPSSSWWRSISAWVRRFKKMKLFQVWECPETIFFFFFVHDPTSIPKHALALFLSHTHTHAYAYICKYAHLFPVQMLHFIHKRRFTQDDTWNNGHSQIHFHVFIDHSGNPLSKQRFSIHTPAHKTRQNK